ncbi:DUF4342 domain-containing protein [Candidatus Bathyarchaeota archaeon]|nr:DUF4342 domain-containing protein [Candidatus Bathyarchaeota archaeon]
MNEESRYCPNCGAETKGAHWEEFSVATDDLVGRVKQLIAEGNVRRIVVRDEKGDLLLEIPVTAAAIGVLIAPYLAALGAIAAIVTRVTVHIERRD